MTTRLRLALLALATLSGCDQPQQNPAKATVEALAAEPESLSEAREGFRTKLIRHAFQRRPLDRPPSNLFRVVRYTSPVGPLAAYLTLDPRDGKQHPAIVWITGGDCNSIGDVWTPAPADNDQTAAAYRQAGIVMMFPSLRGGNLNPGQKEGFLGEVDDVIAAAEFLASQPFVDPNRIYLGGHSTGGTLALLVAECDDRFRATFSFGPAADIRGYPDDLLPGKLTDPEEIRLRSPLYWLAGIKDPTFIFEGDRGNIQSLQALAQSSKNPNVHAIAIPNADHFEVLAPTNRLIAKKILQDTGENCNLSFTEAEVSAAVGK